MPIPSRPISAVQRQPLNYCEPCEGLATKPQAVVLVRCIVSYDNCGLANILRCVLRRLAIRRKSMDSPHQPWLPSPAPCVFEERIYGLAHCLLDRDGRVIGSHLPLPNGTLMAEAPVMAELLRNLVAGGSIEELKAQAATILCRIDRGRAQEPDEDDE